MRYSNESANVSPIVAVHSKGIEYKGQLVRLNIMHYAVLS